MNRPFASLQPNLSSGDRIRNLKAKTIFNSVKKSFSRGGGRNKNSKIRFSSSGMLSSTRSQDLLQLLNRGYALCEDGICAQCDIDCSGQDISGTGVVRRGVLHCSKKPDWATVTPQTENNLFTHFVSAYLPTTPALPFPMLAVKGISGENLNYDFIDVSENQALCCDDVFPDPLGLYSPFSNTCRPGSEYNKTIFKHKYNQTMIRGDSDINSYPTVCQGGNKTNLSWGNNTKQNYLISYDPRTTKVRFNICPDVKDISSCMINSSGMKMDCCGNIIYPVCPC
jgi:hypothetical protein